MNDQSIDIYNSFYDKELNIVGERKEKYVGKVFEGFNCIFTCKEQELTRDVICVECDGKKYEFAMEVEYGTCPSGWTTSSYGHLEIREVSDFKNMTHKVTKPLKVKAISKIDSLNYPFEDLHMICDDNSLYIGGEYNYCSSKPHITWTEIGGDSYYPTGDYGIASDLFIPIENEHNTSDNNTEEIKEEELEKAKKEFMTFIKETIPVTEFENRPVLHLNDGEFMSVQASAHHYSFPREDFLPSYECYEIGFPSKLFHEIEDDGETPNTTDTVFPYVEQDVITHIVASHGGINFEKTLGKDKCAKIPGLQEMKKQPVESQKIDVEQPKAQTVTPTMSSLPNNASDMPLSELAQIVANLAELVKQVSQLVEKQSSTPKKGDIDF